MAASLNGILVENFKSYNEPQWITLSDLSVLMGANSSGKSSALQALMVLKQTMECNSPDIDLLLSGKFVTLGDFKDVINDCNRKYIRIGISLNLKNEIEKAKDKNNIIWKFDFDSENGKFLLSEIECAVNNCQLKFKLLNNHKYCIYVGGERSSLLVDIYNLQLGKMYAEYDRDFNILFHTFLNELVAKLTQKKKVTSTSKKEMVALYGLDEFFFAISKDMQALNKTEMEDGQAGRIADDIINLIKEYATMQFKEYSRFDIFPESVKYSFLIISVHRIIQNPKGKAEIEAVIEKYKTLLEQYKKEGAKNSYKDYSELEINYLNMQRNSNNIDSAELDKVSEMFIVYKEFLRKVLGKIFYVGPIREKPLGLYNIGFESVPKYVGMTGAYFASVLLHENKVKEYLFPDDNSEETNLWEALAAWTLHLNVASEIHVEQRNSFGFSVSVENTQNRKSDIMNVGIGTSQILPVLITGLLSEENEMLIFEQPELHLHPYSQSRLTDFFVVLAKKGRKIVIETHSEYMILRLRYHILTEHIEEGQIAISFFQNNRGTKVKKGILSSYGNLDYPSDFKDETQELINDLLNAAMIRGKHNETKCSN